MSSKMFLPENPALNYLVGKRQKEQSVLFLLDVETQCSPTMNGSNHSSESQWTTVCLPRTFQHNFELFYVGILRGSNGQNSS